MDTTDILVASASWSEASTLVGRPFRSDWLQVDDEHIEQFERGSYLTEGVSQMNAAGYPDGLIEGFHLLSLLDYLSSRVSFITDPAWMGWNYGFNRVRFVSPVTTRDRLRVSGVIDSLTARGDGLLVTYDVRLEVEGREKPGMVAEWLALWELVDGE